MKQRIKIAILDDHKLFVQGLISIFENDAEIEVESVFYSGLDLIADINKNNFEILLLDLKMPGLDGFQVLDYLYNYKANNLKIKCIVLSTFFDEDTILKCRKYGAKAYLLKIVGKEELRKTIIEISGGFTSFICDSQIRFTQKNEFSYWKDRYQISKREWEIIQLIKQNLTSYDISEQLNISPFTVDTHRKNILYKLDVKNTSALIQKMLTELSM